MKTVLSIQSQVAGARVGNSVAAFAIERLGVRAVQLPTVLLGRRPDLGPPGGGPLSAETLFALLEALRASGLLAQVDTVLVGYLGSEAQVGFVREAIEMIQASNRAARVVIDPVMGDTTTGLYVAPAVATAIAEVLVPRADLITPNLFELGYLGGAAVSSLAEARETAHRLNRACLVTSIPLEGGSVGVLYAAATGDWLAETPRLPFDPKGAGDLLTALFTARRTRGEAPAVALEAAVGATHDVLLRTLAQGGPDLAILQAQDLLEQPETWPRALSLGKR